MKIKRKTKELAATMEEWLKVYLPKVKMRSGNTIDAYEEALSLYLDFLEKKKGITESTFNEENFRKEWIEEWISHSHSERSNSKRTCDLRLAAIRSLLKYLSSRNALFLPYYHGACEIGRLLRGHGKQVDGISRNAVKCLLQAMNGRDFTSRRDLAFFTMMYDTGARAGELLEIQINELKLEDKSPYVIVNGKGNKPRTLLISQKTVAILKSYIRNVFGNRQHPDSYLFFSRTKGRKHHVSIDAMNVRLKTYCRKAKASCPEIPEDLHTHQLRHTACTHWYQDGINLAQISRYLGHESLETTRIYLGISKEEMMSALAKRNPILENKPSTYKDVKGGLRSLIKRKRE